MADQVEIALKILPANETLQQELAKLEMEGWRLVPNFVPAVSYIMMRTVAPVQVQQPAEQALTMKLKIDDSKVHVVRGNGKG